MANSLLKRLLGEAVEDPVEHHLATVGAGVPPAGRAYPEMPPPTLGADETDMGNPEEVREVQIARRLKALASQVAAYAEFRASPISHEIEELADELIQMHGQPPA